MKKSLVLMLFLTVMLGMFNTLLADTYLTESFESAFVGSPGAPSGWTQTMNRPVQGSSEYNWVQNTWTGSAWSVTSSGTNPSGAQSGTGVLWINDYNYMGSNEPRNSRRMESPSINLAGSTSPYIRFWYFNNDGPGINLNFRVVVSSNGGTTWDLLTPIVNGFNTTVSTWNQISVAVPAAYRTGSFKFGFEITNRYGSNNPFIDNVSVEDYTPTTITSAQSGDWNTAATWVGGVVPTANNNVVIAAGHTVTTSSTTGIMGRCQNLTINGILSHSTGTANFIHAFGNIYVSGTGTLNAYNGTSGRTVYCGGDFTVEAGGTANFNISTTAQSTAAPVNITTAASTLVFLGNQPAVYSNAGTLTNGRINNILVMSQGGVTFNSPVGVPFTFGLYLGAVNPNDNLTLGNAAASTTQVIIRANGSFTQNPIWNNTNISQRGNYYFSPNWVPLTQTTLTTGNEIELISGIRTVSGAFTMNTHNNLQLTYPLTLGIFGGTGSWALTRGIVITDDTNLLFTQSSISTATGTAPSTATPPTSHGSYVAGPLRRLFASSGTATRVFPLGVGTDFNGATPNGNVLKSFTLAPGTANGQSPTLSLVAGPSGSVNSPLTTIMGPRACRINLNGGNDFPATATLALTCMNYTYGNSDNLLGSQAELRIAQSTSISGPWTERSATSGTGAIADNTVYTRTTSTGAPGPIAPIATNGEYFAWATTAAGQSFTSCTTTQAVTTTVYSGDTNQQIIGLQIVATGALAPLNVSQFQLSTNGTTDLNNITNAKLYRTGNSSTFATTTQYGSTVVSPGATFNIDGSYTLLAGTNYFWLTYDIAGLAPTGNIVDAECNAIVVGGIERTPDIKAPDGYRTITNPVNFDYPYTMDFEEVTVAGNLPLYWSKAGTRWTTLLSTDTYNRAPRSGVAYATCQYSSTTTDWLFSRPMFLDESTLYDLGIWYNTDGLAGWTSVKLYIGTSATGAAMTTELASVLSPVNTTYAQLVRNAWQPSATGVYYIGIQVIATSGPWYLSFDDFTITETPRDPVFAINPTSKAFGLKGVFTQTDQVFTISNAGLGTLKINGLSLDGDDCFSIVVPPELPIELEAGQNYPFTVRYQPIVAGDFASIIRIDDNLDAKAPREVPLSGSAFDPILPLPYTQNFNASTSLPTNWTQSTSTWTIGSTHARSGNGIYKNIYSTVPNGWFQTQPIGPITGSTRLSFYYRLVNYSSYPTTAFSPSASDKIKIWASTNEGTSFTQVGEINSTNHTVSVSWAEKQVWLSGFKANNGDRVVLKFEAIYGSGDWYIDIDDITVTNIDPNPVFAINPTSKDFGSVQIGNTVSQVFTISNAGINPLIIQAGGINLSGAGVGAYNLTDTNTYPISLGASATANVTVNFHPTVASETPLVATLNIVDNTASKAVHQIALTGVGIDKTIYNLPHIVTLSETPQAQYWYQETIGTGVTNRWSITATNNAGGTSPEFTCAFQNINPGTTRLVSPPVSITDRPKMVVKYLQQIDDYAAGCTYKFRYSYDAVNFVNIWTLASASNTTSPAEEKEFTLESELTGHDRIYFCWEIEGNLYNFDYWYIDNIKFLLPNTQVTQTTATGGTATVTPPAVINPITEEPITPPQIVISNLTNPTAVVNVGIGYASPNIELPNAGLNVTLSGTTFVGTTVTITHNLGFVPAQIMYRVLPNDWVSLDISTPGVVTWNSTTVAFTVTSKADGDIVIVFPQAEGQTLPVEMSSFTAAITSEYFVNLKWTVQSETDHMGYNVMRSITNKLSEAIKINGNIITPENGNNTGSQIKYSFIDDEVEMDNVYYYWLESVSLNNTTEFYGPVMATLGNPNNPDGPPVIPTVTALLSAFPNPFNPSTTIRYTLKDTQNVRIDIYNIKGQLIRSFVKNNQPAGPYSITWDGKDMNGKFASSGVYFYRMNAGKYNSTRKMMLMK